MTDMASAMTTAENVVEQVMKIEPTVATIAGMFIPGAAPVVATVQPIVLLAAPYIEEALKNISAGNGGNALASVAELLAHLTKGMPNSPVLSPTT